MVSNTFNYSETVQLEFKIPLDVNLALFSDEYYANLYIYSYAFATKVEFYLFEEIKSALSECILNDARLYLTYDADNNDIMILEMTPTGLCNNQFRIGSTDSYLKEVKILINTNELQVDKENFSIFTANTAKANLTISNADNAKNLISLR